MSASWGFDDEPERTVVGVVGDTRVDDPREVDMPSVYVPNGQFGANVVYFTLRRAGGTPSALAAAREIVRETDPRLAIIGAEALADAVGRETASTHFYLTLLALFSTLALVLASGGLYGVVAYSVSRRGRAPGRMSGEPTAIVSGWSALRPPRGAPQRVDLATHAPHRCPQCRKPDPSGAGARGGSADERREGPSARRAVDAGARPSAGPRRLCDPAAGSNGAPVPRTPAPDPLW